MGLDGGPTISDQRISPLPAWPTKDEAGKLVFEVHPQETGAVNPDDQSILWQCLKHMNVSISSLIAICTIPTWNGEAF
jgi:hypothetical protein